MSEILQYFPGTPRTIQAEVLETLEKYWDKFDVLVVQAPVASGKSKIALTVSDWLASSRTSSAVLTPTNVLVRQYQADNAKGKSLRRRNSYRHLDEYVQERYDFEMAGQILSNYMMYLSMRAYRDVAIFDEAHNVVSFLQSNIKLWQHLHGWPEELEDAADVIRWLRTHHTGIEHRDAKVRDALDLIDKKEQEFSMSLDIDEYRGNERVCLTLTPLDARQVKPILWPRRVKKIVMMSATINEHDMYDLGLDQKRILYVQCRSPIPPANRPVYPLNTTPVNYKNLDTAVPLLADEIRRLLAQHDTSGVIHCTYGLAAKLQLELQDEERLMWHSPTTRDERYAEFCAQGQPRACGLRNE